MKNHTSGQSIPGHSAAVRPPGDGLPNQPRQIDAAHARSMSYGLESGMDPDFSTVARGELSSALEESRFLFQHAEPVMETLYDQIMNTHSMVLLTSSRGMVLHSLGDTDFVKKKPPAWRSFPEPTGQKNKRAPMLSAPPWPSRKP